MAPIVKRDKRTSLGPVRSTKNRVLPVVVAGVCAEVVCVGARAWWASNATAHIAQMGIVAYRRSLSMFTVAGVVIAVLVFIAVFIAARSTHAQDERLAEQVASKDAASLSEGDITVLKRLGEVRDASWADEFSRSAAKRTADQVVRISRRRTAFEEVVGNTGDGSVGQVMDVLAEADAAVTKNASSIINRLSMYERYLESDSERDRERRDHHQDKARTMMDKNDALIDEAGTLIDEAMTYMEERSGNDTSSLLDVIANVRGAIEDINSGH